MLGPKLKLYIAAVTTAGIAAAAASASAWETGDPSRLVGYLLLALAASAVKTRIPGVTGSVSLGFVAVLAGVAVMSLTETVLGVTLAAILQTYWRPSQRPKAVQVVFNTSVLAASAWMAYTVAHAAAPASPLLRVAAGVAPLYLFNVSAVAGLLSLQSTGTLFAVWEKFQFEVFPCYVMGAVLAALLTEVHLASSGWTPVLPPLALSYLMFNSYRNWLHRPASRHRTPSEA